MLVYCSKSLIELKGKNLDHLGFWEVTFMLFACGFILDEYAQAKEHGWSSEYQGIIF